MAEQPPSTDAWGEVKTDIRPTKDIASVDVASTSDEPSNQGLELKVVPLKFKFASILLVSAIGFGSSWSGGITGAMKATLKKVCCRQRPRFGVLTEDSKGYAYQ